VCVCVVFFTSVCDLCLQLAAAERHDQRKNAFLDAINIVSVSEVVGGCMQGEMAGRRWQGAPRDSFPNRSWGAEVDPLQASDAHLAVAVAARVAVVAASAAPAPGSSAAAPAVAESAASAVILGGAAGVLRAAGGVGAAAGAAQAVVDLMA
jgi:hypothetical protein